MKRIMICNLIAAFGIAALLCLPARLWAANCCDESETGCRTGQAVGDSCGSGNVCGQLADKCPKPKDHPGVLCTCSKPDSSLELPGSLDFKPLNLSKSPSATAPVTVKNGGHIPLDVTLDLTISNNAFSTTQLFGTVPPLGKLKIPVTFAPGIADGYTGNLHV